MDILSIITTEISAHIYYFILFSMIGLGFLIASISVFAMYICVCIYEKHTPISIWITLFTGLITLAINIGIKLILSSTALPISIAAILSLVITVIIIIIGFACATQVL